MTWAKAIVETMEDQGVDVAPILEPLSLDKKTLSDRDSMIEQDVVSELWEAAVIATGNQNLGFVVGRKIHTVLNSVVAYSLMSCTNLKMSCERLLRYQDIVAEGLELEMRETDHEIHLILDILPSNLPPSPQAIKSAVAGFLSFMRWITRSDLQPLSMYLKESRPDDMEPYSALVTTIYRSTTKKTGFALPSKISLHPYPRQMKTYPIFTSNICKVIVRNI